MISRRKFLGTSLLAAIYGASVELSSSPLNPASQVNSTSPHPVTPWHNWSGALDALPAKRIAPSSEEELLASLKQNSGAMRPVGAGHSFSALVPTDGALLVLDKLSGLISHDEHTSTAVFGAGTRLGDTGPLLDSVGQAMINLPDIDRQTLAGAISTSTHGTGRKMGSLSKYITQLRLLTPKGDVYDLSRSQHPDLFDAARVGLGALGVVTRIGFQNRPAFRLKSSVWIEKTDDVIESFAERIELYEHYEFMPFLHADYSMVIAHQETDDELLAPEPEEDAGDIFSILSKIPVMMRKPIINFLLSSIKPSESIEASYQALTNVRNDRFNEMEYSVPVDAGLDCLKEILQLISRQGADAVIPLEYRVVDSDDTWLGMFTGEAKASISIHRMAAYDYRPYFDLIEPIFWKYGGRPHWGKVHSLGFDALTALYPRLKDFAAIQKEMDPKGQLLNKHLKMILGSEPS